MSRVSLKTYFEQMNRKNDPLDPRGLSAAELAGLLHGQPSVIATIEAWMDDNPDAWQLEPVELARRLVLLPGVGPAAAVWWVLNELQVGARVAEALQRGAATAPDIEP